MSATASAARHFFESFVSPSVLSFLQSSASSSWWPPSEGEVAESPFAGSCYRQAPSFSILTLFSSWGPAYGTASFAS
jgi:hypothetical protein